MPDTVHLQVGPAAVQVPCHGALLFITADTASYIWEHAAAGSKLSQFVAELITADGRLALSRLAADDPCEGNWQELINQGWGLGLDGALADRGDKTDAFMKRASWSRRGSPGSSWDISRRGKGRTAEHGGYQSREVVDAGGGLDRRRAGTEVEGWRKSINTLHVW